MNENNKLDGTATSGIIKTVFFAVVIIVSMFATYGFATTFTPDFAPDFFGEFRSIVSGVLMVFMLDGAALIWQYLRLNEASSEKQIEIAEEMSKITIGAAIAITVSYLILTNYGLVTDPVVIAYAGYIGMTVVIVVFGYSFFRVWSFFDADPRATKKKKLVSMKASYTEQSLAAVEEQLEGRRSQMIEEVVNDLIDSTEQEIKDAMRGYRKGDRGKTGRRSPGPAPAPAPVTENDYFIAYHDGRYWRKVGMPQSLNDAKGSLPSFIESDPDMVWGITDVNGRVVHKAEPRVSPNGNSPN